MLMPFKMRAGSKLPPVWPQSRILLGMTQAPARQGLFLPDNHIGG